MIAGYITHEEFPGVPFGTWFECADLLPPYGVEVIVEKHDGRVTALALFTRYEGGGPDHWDNVYPGSGNCTLMRGVVRWQRLPPAKGKADELGDGDGFRHGGNRTTSSAIGQP